MPKIKSDAEMQAHIDKEYPSQTLYTSPPEVLSLKAWVREIEEKRGDKPQVGAFMDTTKKSIEWISAPMPGGSNLGSIGAIGIAAAWAASVTPKAGLER